MELQSGFVLAAILAAVLFATRIGIADDLARRLLQVALGVSIAFATVSATTAFIRAPEPPEEALSGGFDDEDDEQYEFLEDIADHSAMVTTVHAGVGLLAVLGGLAALRRYPVTSLGVALGGLLLLLFGGRGLGAGDGDPASLFFASYASLLGSFLGGASSRWIDVAHFLVMLGGTVALALFGYLQFDEQRPGGETSLTQQEMPE
jgi:hypothetical protein